MLKVEFGALDTAAADIGTRANQIEARLNQLDADLAPLRADWTGEASAAYQSAKATWTSPRWAIKRFSPDRRPTTAWRFSAGCPPARS